MRHSSRWWLRALVLWCAAGILLTGPRPPTARALAPVDACAGAGPIAHASAGLDFGGKELSQASAARTAAAIESALTGGALPPGAQVVDGHVVIPNGPSAFTIRVEPVRMPGGLPYAPVATVHMLGPDEAVVRVSDRAAADLIRHAVAARLTEVAVVVTDRANQRRPDVTSGLTEGVLTTAGPDGRIPFSPKDFGQVTALKLLGDQLPRADAKVKNVALGEAMALGLLDQDPEHPVHQMAGNAPLVGTAAAEARAASIRALRPDSAASLDKVLALAGKTDSQAALRDIRAERDCQHRALRAAADQTIAQRADADADLTNSLNAKYPNLPVIPHVIVGSGWAATVDYLTLPPLTNTSGDTPSVLAVASGSGVVNNLGDFRLTQPAMDNELPGAPFQPADFAEDRDDFVFSTAFGRAVGVARALAGMPTYRTLATKVETKPAGASWPAGARYRLTTSDGRELYAHSLDLATGLGPARIPQAVSLAGRTFVDPRTGYQTAVDPSGDIHVLDPAGHVYTGQLPAETSWLLGVRNVDGIPQKLYDPFLLDPQGRPTERRVSDPDTGYSVDPGTQATYDPSGTQVDPATLDPTLRARLGFLPAGYRDPRFVPEPDSPYSVHPVTTDVILTSTGEPVDRGTLSATVLARLDALVREHRVQFGGENTSASYRPTDELLVVGGGAGGASEVEQARYATRQVTWGARRAKLGTDYPQGPPGALDPKGLRLQWNDADRARRAEIERDLSFVNGGFNRRNTLPEIGAFALPIWDATIRTTDLPVTVRYTTDGRFRTTDAQDRPATFTRIVYTIGQEADYPGGAAALIGTETRLYGVLGPDRHELNGLRDAYGGLRVLGAASVTGAVLKLTREDQQALTDKIKDQAQALPPDARDIHPSIRYHAQRIAEMNRTVNLDLL
ncbi:hypothetical protein EV192_107410 [Actinocrispum wychmicini]|uniref:Uncharacterized protein n=1 Tax=Actinocrispum wychmicini TaxID=1213861 RepID=A0A4R2JP96_9PSEU|nr:hypothetical protein EV192_107410 [Actinocrispum wychmicini]